MTEFKSELTARAEREYEKIERDIRNLEVSMRSEVRALTIKVDAIPGDLNLASERRATEIHKRVNELEKLTGRMEGILSRMEEHS